MDGRFVRDDAGLRTLVDASGVRTLTEDEPGVWTTHLVASSWAGWVSFARLILSADQDEQSRG